MADVLAPASQDSRRPDGLPAEGGFRKMSFTLSPGSLMKLGVTAVMESRSRSEIVESLIQEHLNEYEVIYEGDAASA
ncbi:hypothetical protein [Planctomyces sp. SH-PL62]|uniref:hypothetical protein n=1 Tax=Planctomyces sp. SH-PL62 TaxID=1636152 RepID=UPI00078D698D|nr:hypothetical protein [Planctomyces sp. SH-PL62]AMV41057.1 hypothetical protein VT85_26715 [Planctomyces sp. SH-PL62]